ncbi:MAG: hypothetical protein QM756_03935 [Polyangiaceae bacterium]
MTTLRVLLFEEDPSVLSTVCSWLIEANCEVNTQRSGGNILETVQRARAEVVLLDPLMGDLSNEALALLLTRCHHAGAPSVILHSRLTKQMLRVLTNLKLARGVIHKGIDSAEFLRTFRALTQPDWSKPANSQSPAASGTHRIAWKSGDVVELNVAGRPRR